MPVDPDIISVQTPLVATSVKPGPRMEIGLFTGGRDRPYAFGLVKALTSEGLYLHVVGGDELDGLEICANSGLKFANFYGKSRPESSRLRKAWGLLFYYARLIPYAAVAKPKIFHILWNVKFEYFDRTLLAPAAEDLFDVASKSLVRGAPYGDHAVL